MPKKYNHSVKKTLKRQPATVKRPARYKVHVEQRRCKGCGLCVAWCPRQHLHFSDTINAQGCVVVEKRPGSECSGCGFCYLICPDWCITIHEAVKK